jgi:DNA-binding NtrC family response regulator
MRLLIIGELEGQFSAASKIALERGASVKQTSDIETALYLLRSGQGADLILVDVKQNIQELISKMNNEHIHVPVVGCGFDNNVQNAVNAIKAGAKEYMPLPPNEELIAAIFEAISEESAIVKGKSPAMQSVLKLVDRVAASDASILVTGESGTGKEIISRYIYKKSKRANKPFISVNCAAIPDNLLESELFGHEKGAFTGAIARRIGKFEEANNGTLLLDEISEIDIKLQAKLLRAIQEREIDRIGGTKPIKLNIRIIATSNRDLRQEVSEGRFREDLFFRLNIINVELPPLRQRKEDIPVFAENFIEKYSKLNGIVTRPLLPSALEKMQNYDWPGNVRELENTIHRAVLLSSEDFVTEEALMLPKLVREPNSAEIKESSLVGRTVDSVEKELIISTLSHCLGNRTHAANILGISIRTLRNKLNSYSKEYAELSELSSVE